MSKEKKIIKAKDLTPENMFNCFREIIQGRAKYEVTGNDFEICEGNQYNPFQDNSQGKIIQFKNRTLDEF